MTVLENVMTAHHLRTRQMLPDAVLGTGRHHHEEHETRDRAMELLKIFDLERFADEPATACLTAASGGSRLRGRWRPSRSCCCSTSPRPA